MSLSYLTKPNPHSSIWF